MRNGKFSIPLLWLLGRVDEDKEQPDIVTKSEEFRFSARVGAARDVRIVAVSFHRLSKACVAEMTIKGGR